VIGERTGSSLCSVCDLPSWKVEVCHKRDVVSRVSEDAAAKSSCCPVPTAYVQVAASTRGVHQLGTIAVAKCSLNSAQRIRVRMRPLIQAACHRQLYLEEECTFLKLQWLCWWHQVDIHLSGTCGNNDLLLQALHNFSKEETHTYYLSSISLQLNKKSLLSCSDGCSLHCVIETCMQNLT
jgi:hypothetical protein